LLTRYAANCASFRIAEVVPAELAAAWVESRPEFQRTGPSTLASEYQTVLGNVIWLQDWVAEDCPLGANGPVNYGVLMSAASPLWERVTNEDAFSVAKAYSTTEILYRVGAAYPLELPTRVPCGGDTAMARGILENAAMMAVQAGLVDQSSFVTGYEPMTMEDFKEQLLRQPGSD
jgi:hypothetical protein